MFLIKRKDRLFVRDRYLMLERYAQQLESRDRQELYRLLDNSSDVFLTFYSFCSTLSAKTLINARIDLRFLELIMLGYIED